MTESFAALLDESLSTLDMQPGSIVSGVVLDVDNDWVTVHVGLKSEGVVPLDEFRNNEGEVSVSVGDEVEILLKAEEAFGPKIQELIFTDDINNVPLEYRYIGATVTMQNDKGGTKDFIVSNIEDGKLTIDGNHPLAGKDIIFYVEVLSIRDATADEIIEGGSIE